MEKVRQTNQFVLHLLCNFPHFKSLSKLHKCKHTQWIYHVRKTKCSTNPFALLYFLLQFTWSTCNNVVLGVPVRSRFHLKWLTWLTTDKSSPVLEIVWQWLTWIPCNGWDALFGVFLLSFSGRVSVCVWKRGDWKRIRQPLSCSTLTRLSTRRVTDTKMDTTRVTFVTSFCSLSSNTLTASNCVWKYKKAFQ